MNDDAVTTLPIRPAKLTQPWTWALHWQILAGLVVGVGIGSLIAAAALSAAETAGKPTYAATSVENRYDYMALRLIGDLFLNGLKLIVIPIITTSIILAIAGLGSHSAFRRLGLKTLAYYMLTSLAAILIGLTLVNLIAPGSTPGDAPLFTADMGADFSSEAQKVQDKSGGKTGSDFLDVFRQMVPPNIVQAANGGNFIGLIVVSMLVGFFATRLPDDRKKAFLGFIEAVYDITLAITHFVLKLAPIGVCGLIAATIALHVAKLAPDDRVAELFSGIAKFALTVMLALGLHFFVVMPLILCFVARVNPIRHYMAMGPAIMTALSTSSSSSTLPVTMECVEERAGVSRKTTSFVLPLGATVNMDGTALFECVAAIFICQAFGIELSLGQQFMIVVVALLTSVGVAGVPSASIVAIVVILRSVEEQLQAQGLDYPLVAVGVPIIFAIDRPLDMCRTVVNIFSDSVGAVVVGRSEGEPYILEPISK